MRYVYCLMNKLNGKVYIGQTKAPASRKASHFYEAKRGNHRHLYASIRKYGQENFSFDVIEECEDDVINEREQYWVSHYDSYNPEKGYNLTRGGEGTIGSDKPKTPEHKEKMRQAQKKYWSNPPASDTRRQKLAERNATQKAKQTSKDAQLRRWSNPESKEAVKKLWQDPIWRSKELTRRKKARELKKLRLSEIVDISVNHIPERIA